MIVARDIRGKEIKLPKEVAMIEILSSDGKLGNLLMFTREGLALLGPDDEEFLTYSRIRRLSVAESIEI